MVRNQMWNQKHELIEDIETILVDGKPTVINHLANSQRPANGEEIAVYQGTEKREKRRQAKERAIAAIKANQDTPWGKLLYDLMIAEGWEEPE